jgi:hypothetical protein
VPLPWSGIDDLHLPAGYSAGRRWGSPVVGSTQPSVTPVGSCLPVMVYFWGTASMSPGYVSNTMFHERM